MSKEELKFSSEDEAIQHLANLTGKRIKIAEESKNYVEIVFLQNSQDFDDFTDKETGESGIDAFFDASEDDMIDYLMKWEYGDRGTVRKENPGGTSDNTFEKKFGNDTYMMNYNRGLGYAGLTRIEE